VTDPDTESRLELDAVGFKKEGWIPRVPISFEIAAPVKPVKDPHQTLYAAEVICHSLTPDFITITGIGMDDGLRERHTNLPVTLQNDHEVTVAPIVEWGVGRERLDANQMEEHLMNLVDIGIKKMIVHPPADVLGSDQLTRSEVEHPLSALGLLETARRVGQYSVDNFSLGVLLQPEGHPFAKNSDILDEYPDPETNEFERMAAELDVADFGIAQFGFYTEPYLNLLKKMADRGINKPIIPSVYPFRNLKEALEIAIINGIDITTPELKLAMRRAESDPHFHRSLNNEAVGRELAVNLSLQYIAEGVPSLHILTDNNPNCALQLVERLK
jgi:5,10-methylenetetrahydrofolate reductase